MRRKIDNIVTVNADQKARLANGAQQTSHQKVAHQAQVSYQSQPKALFQPKAQQQNGLWQTL